MADKTDEERVSIWSTGDTERTWLILLASVFFYPSLILVLWHNWHKIVEFEYGTIIHAISTIGSAGLFAVTLAFFIIEGVNLMIIPVEKIREKIRTRTEEYLATRFKEGQRRGYEETIAAVQKMYPDVDIGAIRAAIEEQNGSASNNK